MFFGRKGSEAGSAAGYAFTDRMRRVLGRAREEALALRHDYVGTEHVLLALVRETEDVSHAVLAGLGVAPEEVREQVHARVRPGQAEGAPVPELPWTSRAKAVLRLAMDEAREMGLDYTGTEHLLLGLLREEKGIAAEVLTVLGADLARTRAETLRRHGSALRAPDAFRVRIDDASDLPIYEQIVAQVKEAVATGELRPGRRLPAVRRLADELEIAPGTVARSYAELERLGVVVTDGARGTRVAERHGAPPPDGTRPEVLVGLLRPVAVAAFHLGATDRQLREALDSAMSDIYGPPPGA